MGYADYSAFNLNAINIYYFTMKSNLKKAAFLVSGILLSSRLLAQTADSSMTTTNYVKPFAPGSEYRRWSVGVDAGLLTPYTIFRGKEDFLYPQNEFGYGGYLKYQMLPSFGIQANILKGYVSGENSADGTFQKFRTDLKYAASLSGNFTVANINWRHKHGVIQPYLTAGAGIMGFNVVLTNANGNQNLFKTDGNVTQYYIPVGVGLKINLAPGINLDLGYDVNFVDGDNFDGFTYGARNDKFSYAHGGLEFALGKRSKPQLATYNPVNAMRVEYTLEEMRLQRQLADERERNERLRNDLNTTNANLAKLTVDSDGDGVSDMFDKCPNTPAGTQVDGAGCPLPVKKPDVKVYVTEQDKMVVNEAVKNLEFDFGKATIRTHSLASLDKLAQLLIDKNFSLKLAGYTDNVGSVQANLKLSKERANAIKDYLVSKGASANNITAEGYGKAHPIATNKTEYGRQLNRRVEFSIY
jgi:OOP family OmpA-OmpF porin